MGPTRNKTNIMEVKKWEAYISYFVSLKNFFIQNKEDELIIHEITTSLQRLKEDELSILDCVKLGDLVAAKYEDDGLWYRAKILNINGNVFTVQFIDYGNSGISSNIKKLPKELSGYHSLAYNCMLDDVDDVEHIVVTNNDVYKIVFEFITSIQLIVKFLNHKKPYVVKLKWDYRNIKIFLNNLILYGITPNTYKALKNYYRVGSKFRANFINIISINEFYVEAQYSNEMRKKIENEIANGTLWKPLTEYEIGKMAIAICLADNVWYRVRILEIFDKGECNCYLIDYGVQEKCIQFYEAVGYVKWAPPLIIRCSLHMPNINNKGKIFNGLSKSFIDEMTLCENQKIIITIVKTGEPFVVDLEVNNMNMAKIIEPKSVIIFCEHSYNLLRVQINTRGRLTVMNELSNIKTSQLCPVIKPSIGKIYGAHINEKWYRVKLITIYDHQIWEVITVDMGGFKVFVSELFHLSKPIENIKYLFIYCSLYGFDKQHFSLNKLRQISNGGKTTFTMIVLKNDEKNGHLIQLFLDGKDVLKIIKED